MRLTFPNGEHAAVVIDQGQVGVGSAIGGGTAVAIPGLAPLHAVFACGRRGRWLTVPEEARVVLNARPVRRLAWIRPGDLVCLGSVQVRIESDMPPPMPAAGARPGADLPARHVLRGLNGTWFGCCLPLAASPVTVGRGSAADLRLEAPGLLDLHARFEVLDGRWTVRAATGASLRVNGHAVAGAVLQPGDQIELGEQRLLLEAPGAVAPATSAPAVAQQAPAPLPPGPTPTPPAKDPGGVYLLIAAAAALAAALTAFFVYAPTA